MKWAVWIVAVWMSTGASAGEPNKAPGEAKQLRDLGVEAWEKGEYLEALEDFRKAYALYPSVNLRFNIARVLSDLGRDVEALDEFAAFLEQGKDAPADARSLAKAKIAVLEKRVGTIVVRCSASESAVTLDGKQLGAPPLDQSVRVPPGIHEVVARKAGYEPFIAQVTVLPAEAHDVTVELKPIKVEKPIAKKWWFWTVLGGAAAAVATSVALGVKYGESQDQPPLGRWTVPTK